VSFLKHYFFDQLQNPYSAWVVSHTCTSVAKVTRRRGIKRYKTFLLKLCASVPLQLVAYCSAVQVSDTTKLL